MEARTQGIHVALGPGLNIKRSPLSGGNFEYFSEDPYLAGKVAAGYARGIQSKGVYACPKHFAVNSQELRRMSVDAVLDERTLRELYLTGFELAVKEGGAKGLMTSCNHMRLPQNQTELLNEPVEVNPNLAAILSGGSAIEMTWQADCKAILHGCLGGQAGASAMLDVPTGCVNSSGKLSETYPPRRESRTQRNGSGVSIRSGHDLSLLLQRTQCSRWAAGF